MKKYLSVKILLSIFCLVFGVKKGIGQTEILLDSLVRRAAEANEQRNHLSAIRYYDQIISHMGEEASVARFYLYRGQNRSLISQNAKAKEDFDRAIALRPRYFDAFLARAVLFLNTDEPENAINDFNMAIRFSDSSATILNFLLQNRGLAKQNRGDWEGASRDFQQAAEWMPTDESAQKNWATALLQTNKPDEAMKIYENLLEKSPNSASAHFNLGFVWAQKLDFEKAVSFYTRSLELEPNAPNALNNRGLAHLNLSNYSAALKDLNHCIELYPSDPYAFRNRGMLKIALRRRTEGCLDFQKALELGFSEQYDSEVDEFFKKYCQ